MADIMRIVSYKRVSTVQQGQSGLGLEAQQSAIEAFAASKSARIIAEFVEVESGKDNERPELLNAIHHAKITNSVLVIAKLDRLSRNAAFLLTLRDSGVKFIAADMPDANELTIGIMALIAQQEREAISSRTKAALAAKKARGAVLGNPNGAAALRRAGKGNTAAIAANRAKANRRANDLATVVNHIQASGIKTLRGIADELNAREIATPRGKRWSAQTVKELLARL